MADNFTGKDAGGLTITIDSKDIGTLIQRPRHEAQGPSAVGAAVSGNPVLVGGTDGLNVQMARIGQGTMAQSLSVALASNQSGVPTTVADGSLVALGAQADVAAATDTTATTLIGLFKRHLQRITTLLGQLPLALGQGTMAQSLTVAIASNQTPVQGSAAQGTLTDRSGTVTLGGTSQVLAAANTARKYLLVVNVSAGDIWINFTTAAVVNQPSIKIVANGSFVLESSYITTEAVNVIGATTGQAFSAKEG